MSHATMVLSGRNLKLWSAFSGIDPESQRVTPELDPLGGTLGWGLPQSRTYSLRLDVAF